MERLTEKISEYIQCNNNECRLSYCDRECEHYKRMVNKLAEYEDAEEQGLLLRLPCKVGTEVWKIEQQFWIDRKGCKDCIYFDNDGLGDYCDYCEDNCPACTKIIPTKFEIHMLEEIGKTIFRTREEAEQALKQMKAGEKNE